MLYSGWGILWWLGALPEIKHVICFNSLVVVWKGAYGGVKEAKERVSNWKESLMHHCAWASMSGQFLE